MSDSALWSFFVAAGLSVAVVVVTLSMALVINQRHRLQLQQRFSRQLLQAQDDERAWVAREVHDDALQQVAAVRHTFDRLGQGGDPVAIEAQLGALATTLRTVAHRLHPALLQKAGIATALKQLASEAATTLRLQVVAAVQSPSAEPPAAVGLTFYRVAQEALRNVSQHAGVDRAIVTFAETADSWVLTVSDEGKGGAGHGARGQPSLGLISMRERAALVYGSVTVESEPGRGTSVTLSVPRTAA